MCRRTMLLGSALIAAGAGLLLSVLFEGIFLRVLIGLVLVAAGFLLSTGNR